ncbi:MAG TPA: hypothetical protein VGM44_10595 [Polyangiaceae bacterium]|jgi:hypothetical protein
MTNAGGADGLDFARRVERVEALLAELAQASDPKLESAAREVVATVLELHRRGLERVFELAVRDDATRLAVARDPEVGALLLLHGLHPIPAAERISRAIESLPAHVRGKTDRIEVEALSPDVVTVRVTPLASACGSTRAAIKKDLELTLAVAAPDVTSLQIEFSEAPPALVTLRRGPRAAEGPLARGVR